MIEFIFYLVVLIPVAMIIAPIILGAAELLRNTGLKTSYLIAPALLILGCITYSYHPLPTDIRNVLSFVLIFLAIIIGSAIKLTWRVDLWQKLLAKDKTIPTPGE